MRTRIMLLIALMAIAVSATACFQQSNTYPVEIFKEMHYAQFHRPQEPPREMPPAASVVFTQLGTDTTLNVPAKQERPYDAKQAAELFRVNCSVCHGLDGQGDGPAAHFITSSQSFYATTNGTAYAGPPSLIDARTKLTPDQAYTIVSNGIVVMPKFKYLLSEPDIREIVAYVFDTKTGLGSGQ